MQKLRAVIDSNVLVSILKGSRSLSPIYTAFIKENFRLIISAETIKELSFVLYRPRLNIDPPLIKELFKLMRSKAIRIKLAGPGIFACRDPKDNYLLELSVKAKAHFLVTGDKDLLIMNPFKDTHIITPRKFISILHQRF